MYDEFIEINSFQHLQNLNSGVIAMTTNNDHVQYIDQLIQLNRDVVVGDMITGLNEEKVIGSAVLLANEFLLKYMVDNIDEIKIVMISKFDYKINSITITREEWDVLKFVV